MISALSSLQDDAVYAEQAFLACLLLEYEEHDVQASDLCMPSCHSTGLAALDEVFDGGLYPGKLYGIEGLQKAGKSLTLASIGRNLGYAGVPTFYVCLEMGPTEIGERLLAADLKLNSNVFRRRNNLADLEEGIQRHRETAYPSRLIVEHRPGMAFARVRTIVVVVGISSSSW